LIVPHSFHLPKIDRYQATMPKEISVKIAANAATSGDLSADSASEGEGGGGGDEDSAAAPEDVGDCSKA
jgi:hypothetical protein